jgi:hypothetical protein
LAVRQDLLVGLYGGVFTGTGFHSLTFDLFADGIDEIHRVFTTAAAAKTFFTNDAIDVGSLASGPLSGNTLTLQASFSLTVSSAGSGFYGGLLIGDPPAGEGGAGAPRFAQAMAAFGSHGAAAQSTPAWATALPSPILAMSRAHAYA